MHCQQTRQTEVIAFFSTTVLDDLDNKNDVQEGFFYQCCLPRCAFRNHPSAVALQTHVELSHMSCIALLCPIQGL